MYPCHRDADSSHVSDTQTILPDFLPCFLEHRPPKYAVIVPHSAHSSVGWGTQPVTHRSIITQWGRISVLPALIYVVNAILVMPVCFIAWKCFPSLQVSSRVTPFSIWWHVGTPNCHGMQHTSSNHRLSPTALGDQSHCIDQSTLKWILSWSGYKKDPMWV